MPLVRLRDNSWIVGARSSWLVQLRGSEANRSGAAVSAQPVEFRTQWWVIEARRAPIFALPLAVLSSFSRAKHKNQINYQTKIHSLQSCVFIAKQSSCGDSGIDVN